MIKISPLISRLFFFLFLGFSIFLAASCSKDDDEPSYRHENDIMGVWTNGEDRYMSLDSAFRAYNLYVSTMDGETIGYWEQDGYFYEPGYDIVIYIDKTSRPQVYQIVELTESSLVWCWVEDIMDYYESGLSPGEILGQIINDAHEGFTLDPNNYQYFSRVAEEDFLQLVASLDLDTPW